MIRTDHQVLQWILDFKESIGKLARWRLRLRKFDFEIVHRPGLYHQAANAMFRPPQADTGSPSDDNDVDDDVPTYCIMGQESAVSSIFD